MQSLLNKTLPWIWSALWLILPLSMKGTVILIWLLGLAIIVKAILNPPSLPKNQLSGLILFGLLFLWYAVSILINGPYTLLLKGLEPKLSLILIPLFVILIGQMISDPAKWAARGFYSGLIFAGIHMILHAFSKSLHGFEWNHWMYHDFVKPYSMGAIYFSWYLSTALIYLTYRKQEAFIRKYFFAILLFFILLLLLSASKLFIVITIPFVIWGISKRETDLRKRKIVLIVMTALLIAGSVPFLKRLNELKNTSLEIIRQPEFHYDTPFNGLTFRLLQWRFAKEILDENHAWLSGLGIGNEQKVLNEHYRTYGVYLGNPDLGDTGYLNFNFHDQFLEILVGTGIPGLILLLILVVDIIIRSVRKLAFPVPVFIVLILFFLTESVLERQAGIVFFCLISFLALTKDQEIITEPIYGSSLKHTFT